MNDASEFNYGVKMLRLIASGRFEQSAEVGFDQRVLGRLAVTTRAIPNADLYFTSFCAKGDLLSQWRGYGGQDSRYCLEFDPAGFEPAVSDVAGIFPVIYNDHKQRALLSRVLDKHLNVIPDGDPDDVYKSVKCVHSCCLAAFAFLKDPAFEEEHEWRAVLFAWPGEHVGRLEFVNSAGIMKPCIPLLVGRSKRLLPLKRVIAGASRSISQSSRSAELMLARYGYSNVPVEPSRIPLSG